MGLDIVYYTNIEYIGSIEEHEDAQIHLRQDHFSRGDGLKEGAYTANYGGGFGAGSYSGYNNWRDQLAQKVLEMTSEEIWLEGDSSKPFIELINFSDCEGYIGPKTCAKLAKDFNEYEEKAKKHPPLEDDWFIKKYQEWKTAFNVAADNGVVIFC